MPVKPIVTPFNPQGGKPPVKPLVSALAGIKQGGLTATPLKGGMPSGGIQPIKDVPLQGTTPNSYGNQETVAPLDGGLINPTMQTKQGIKPPQTMDMSPTGQGSQYDLAPNGTGIIAPPTSSAMSGLSGLQSQMQSLQANNQATDPSAQQYQNADLRGVQAQDAYSAMQNKVATGGDSMAQSPIGGGLTNTPMAGGNPQALQSSTPGGLMGGIDNTRYNNPYASGNNGGSGRNGGNGGSIGGSGGQSQYGSTPNGGSGNNTNNFGNFDQFRDSALDQAMRTLNPQMDSNNAAFEQMMVSRGIQPGTKQYDAQRANLDMRNNDMLGQATYGAQQQGLAAQNQAWNQDYQYDALKNALNQTNVSAAASRYGANQSAAASRYGSDNNLRQAEMANSLGYDRLNQQGREFDINDIYRNQQLDLQGALGFGNLDLGQQSQNRQDWQANQGADTNWWNRASGMMNNAPGVNFQPTGDFVGNTMQAGQNQQNNTNQQNAAIAGLLGSGLSMMSDERLKENIMYVDTIDGVNVYDFDYIDKSLGADRYRGVMAQEVIDTHPESVSMVNGSYMVDYSQLPVNMEVI